MSIIFCESKRKDNFISVSTFKGKIQDCLFEKKNFKPFLANCILGSATVTTGKQLIKQSATSTSIRRLRFDIAPPIITGDQRAGPRLVNEVMICDLTEN